MAALAAALEFDHLQDVGHRGQVRGAGHAEPGGDDPPLWGGTKVVLAVVVAQVPGVECVGVQPGHAEVELPQVERRVVELGKNLPVGGLGEQHGVGHRENPS